MVFPLTYVTPISAGRAALVAMIGTHEEAYTPAEEKIVEDGVAMFGLFGEHGAAKAIKMMSSLVKAKIAYKAGNTHAYGWASTTVRARYQHERRPSMHTFHR